MRELILCDKQGALVAGDPSLSPAHAELAGETNPRKLTGTLAQVLPGADLFIGVSAPGILTGEMVRTMHADAMVFAMANPVPEILPEEALEAGAAVVGTGRSDYPNQINNVLAFPGIFRGALDARARDINDAMQLAAARAIAGCISEKELSVQNILPSALDKSVVPREKIYFEFADKYIFDMESKFSVYCDRTAGDGNGTPVGTDPNGISAAAVCCPGAGKGGRSDAR